MSILPLHCVGSKRLLLLDPRHWSPISYDSIVQAATAFPWCHLYDLAVNSWTVQYFNFQYFGSDLLTIHLLEANITKTTPRLLYLTPTFSAITSIHVLLQNKNFKTVCMIILPLLLNLWLPWQTWRYANAWPTTTPTPHSTAKQI